MLIAIFHRGSPSSVYMRNNVPWISGQIFFPFFRCQPSCVHVCVALFDVTIVSVALRVVSIPTSCLNYLSPVHVVNI